MATIPHSSDFLELPERSASADLLDSLMTEEVTYKQGAGSHSHALGNAAGVTKVNYDALVALGNVSSYSMDEVFFACPRKYAIKKMQADAGTHERINSATFAFGHAVGAGVACYDETLDMRQAVLAAFLAWDIDLLESEFKNNKRTGKSFHEAIWALYVYKQFVEEETDLGEYDVVKSEATIVVDFEDGHYYVGHIDELLKNRYTGKYRVKENKTTGFGNIDPALYSNSEQALSYAVVIDMLGGQDYEVLYTIYSSAAQQWIQFPFVKTAHKKAEWLQDQLLVHQQRDDYAASNFFPKRGKACFSFMRRCEFYEDCDLSLTARFGKGFSDLHRITDARELEKIEHIDYFTTLTDIVARQKEKVNHGI